MKFLTVMTLFLLAFTTAVAEVEGNSAEWIVEAGSLYVQGTAAADLYEDMEAKSEITDATTRHEVRTKKSDAIVCRTEFIRGLAEVGAGWVPWEITDAHCNIKVHPKIIGPRY